MAACPPAVFLICLKSSLYVFVSLLHNPLQASVTGLLKIDQCSRSSMFPLHAPQLNVSGLASIKDESCCICGHLCGHFSCAGSSSGSSPAGLGECSRARSCQTTIWRVCLPEQVEPHRHSPQVHVTNLFSHQTLTLCASQLQSQQNSHSGQVTI